MGLVYHVPINDALWDWMILPLLQLRVWKLVSVVLGGLAHDAARPMFSLALWISIRAINHLHNIRRWAAFHLRIEVIVTGDPLIEKR